MNIYTVELLTQKDHKPFSPRQWLMDNDGLVFQMSCSQLEAKCRRELPNDEWRVRTLTLIATPDEGECEGEAMNCPNCGWHVIEDKRIAELKADNKKWRDDAIILMKNEERDKWKARAERAEADRDALRGLFADSVSAIQRRYGLGYAKAAKIQADAKAALADKPADMKG